MTDPLISGKRLASHGLAVTVNYTRDSAKSEGVVAESKAADAQANAAGSELDMFDKVIATNLRGTFLVLGQGEQYLHPGGHISAFSTSVIARSLPNYDPRLTDMDVTQLTKTEQFRYQDSHLEISLAENFAVLDSRRLTLTRKEYQLLALLVENAGELVPREVLLMRIWGYGDGIRTRTLDVHIRRLRIQLGSYSEQYIETVFGMGYRFRPFGAHRRFSLQSQ
jgi:DNA-binding winged helix-turn-helix (wHTH) protein